jgi:hypothetical protein
MVLTRANAVEFDALRQEHFDAVIAASGYESRARHVAGVLAEAQLGRRIALGFLDRADEPERKKNDRAFQQLGYELPPADGDCGDEPARIVRELSQASRNGCLNLLVDYSSMTRVWYSAILREAALSARDVRLCLVYSPAQFQPPPVYDECVNEWMGPLRGFSHLRLPERPIALVIGLGYEKGKSLALTEYVDAMPQTYAFYTDPGSHPEYVRAVLESNAELLDRLPPHRVVKYPFNNVAVAGVLLNTLVSSLVARRRVILAPLGPKPFCVLSLILSMREPYVDVWRVSGGKQTPPIPREATGEVVALEVAFQAS